ncbi:hypothetical protein Q4Q34_01370 [Flavivirga abyssicola]|uniref:hypothetical protein n=1 Tax=Flavivirga abyssicola TaxID=3063533 RepID=UPI0026E06847|nr:hypothetical protein [Flavivirga sp. MEBiC07777]WVK13688.1 hypothetical protein Q4Q34_01370 [Flavivirga sp. MEBiC07777]
MKNQMQKIKSVILLIIIATFSSCQFNQSVNKDLTTGAYSRGDGIGIDGVVIEINGETDNRNEFVFGEKVNLVFNNITGLTNLDGKTFPRLSMHVVKNEKDTVLFNPNLLKSLNNGTDLSPLQLQANFRTALPNRNNEKYKVFIEITDKKGDGKFNYELPFTIKENDLLDIKGDGIEYSTIYLWNETLKQPVFDNNVSSEHLFILILNDIQGLELTNEKVFPIFSLDLTDNNGNKILSNPNLLSAYEEVGVNPKDLKSQVTAKLTFAKGKINNPCRLNTKLKDKNSSKEINISTELNIN